jgi:hypothetical protein
MIFMIPTPPTISEIDATAASNQAITLLALSEAFVEIAHSEVVLLAGNDMMATVQNLRNFHLQLLNLILPGNLRVDQVDNTKDLGRVAEGVGEANSRKG